MLLLPVLSLSSNGFNFCLEFLDMFFLIFHMFSMTSSHIIKVSVKFRNILIVLSFEAINSIKEFDFIFPLDQENLILKPLNMSLQIILSTLIFLNLLLIALKQKINLRVLSCHCFVKVLDFLHQGIFDILGQISNMGDP